MYNEFFFPFAFLILEKISAVNKYNPPPEVVAAQDHMTHVVNSVMQPQRIFDRYSERRLGWNSGWSAQYNLLISLAISLVTHSFFHLSEEGIRSSFDRLCYLRYSISSSHVQTWDSLVGIFPSVAISGFNLSLSSGPLNGG